MYDKESFVKGMLIKYDNQVLAIQCTFILKDKSKINWKSISWQINPIIYSIRKDSE